MRSLPEQVSLNESDLPAVGELTLAALKAADLSDAGEVMAILALCAGAVSERCGRNAAVLRTEEHARAVFGLVIKVLEENTSKDDLLDSLCPPLMAFFNQQIPLLKQLRSDVAKNLEDTKILPMSMAREFLLMCVDEQREQWCCNFGLCAVLAFHGT